MIVSCVHAEGVRKNGLVRKPDDERWSNGSLFIRNFREYTASVSSCDCTELRDIVFNAEVRQFRLVESIVLEKQAEYMQDKGLAYLESEEGLGKTY
jgi:hypothetical protein